MRRDYSRRIQKLRAALRLTQHAFAGRLRVQPQVVASWEQGRREPSADSYRQLAKLAPPADAWFFLEKIGVTKELVRAKWKVGAASPEAENRAANSRRVRDGRSRNRSGSQLKIPVLRDGELLNPRRPHPRDIAGLLSFPATLFPKTPGAYVAVHVHGSAMEPVLRDGFLVLLDQTPRDPSQLIGRMVGVQQAGRVSVKWLAAGSGPGRWVLHSESRQEADVVVETQAADFLVGAVVFWWGAQG